VVDGGDLLRDAEGMVQGWDLDGGADPDPAGAGGDGAGHLQRGGNDGAGRSEVDLAEPDAVDAPELGPVCHLEDIAKRGRLARSVAQLLDEDTEVHGVDTGLEGRASQGASRVLGAPGRVVVAYGAATMTPVMTLLIVLLGALLFVACLVAVGRLWKRKEQKRTARQWDDRERLLDRKKPVGARSEIRHCRARPRT
jgi:hypothetical protein